MTACLGLLGIGRPQAGGTVYAGASYPGETGSGSTPGSPASTW